MLKSGPRSRLRKIALLTRRTFLPETLPFPLRIDVYNPWQDEVTMAQTDKGDSITGYQYL